MNLFLILFTALLLICTILPLVRNDYWIFRVFDYPRIQKFCLTLISLVLICCFYTGPAIIYWGLILLTIANGIHLLWLVIPFTVWSKKQVLTARMHIPGQNISIMVTNVFEDNTNSAGCLHEIKKADPDIVILLETNARWDAETRPLEKTFPYFVRVPLENTYGLLLYSRLELLNPEVKYLVEKDIPSIHVQVRLGSGQLIQLYAVHPTPPVPGENVRSTERDKELLLVAELAEKCKLPVIVAGDLNDVAWSYTTELFLKMSGLLDPRRGRGFFNSFHAHYPLLRFPLDHAFTSEHFKLKTIKRLSNFGSDHFPIYLKLQYEAAAARQQSQEKPDADDIIAAQEKKKKI